MKKMTKILALVMALVMVLSLAACGAKIDDTQGQEDVVEIELATFPVGSWGDQATVESLIADFNAVYPNIKVNVTLLAYGGDGDNQIDQRIEANEAPDIIFEGPERLVAKYGEMGVMVDLSDLMLDEVIDVAKKPCVNAAGAVYEIPLCMTAHTMAINKTLFEEAGALQYVDVENHTWTTEGFINAVNALADYGVTDIAELFCKGSGGDQGTRALITNLYEGTFAKADHSGYTVNSPENIKAIETLIGLPGFVVNSAHAGGDEATAFAKGQLAMAFCWNAATHTNNLETIAGAGFEVLPMAFPSEDGVPELQGGVWGFGVFDNGDEAKIEAAKTFIQFMTADDEMYKKAVAASGQFTVRDVEGAYAEGDLKNDYAIFLPLFGDYYQVTTKWTEARTAWSNALQAIGTGTSAADALAGFDAELG